MLHIRFRGVYLNLEWNDLRGAGGFYCNLTTGLENEGIERNLDNERDDTFEKINNSKMALVVLSERYSERNWNLNELVKIMENVEDNKLEVLPILYKVEVEDVRYCTGEFGKNLYRGGDRDRDRSNMPKWEHALRSVTDRKGLTSADHRTQGDLIAHIVEEINYNRFKIGSSSSNILSGALSPRVYINFQGVDVRHNFISHLDKALKEGGIKYFIEDLVPSHGPLEKNFNKIDDSKIALAIFSERYSQSNKCLNELLKIMDNKEEKQLRVIPIFFKVKVEDVEFITGDFGKNFYKGSRRDNSNMPKWEKALKSVANIKGFTSSDYRTEAELSVNIVMEILFPSSPVRKVEEGNNMLSTNIQTASSSSNILSGTVDQPRMDLPLYVIEKLFKQLEDVNIVLEIKNMLSQISAVREVEEGNNMLSTNIQTESSSSNILSGTTDQPTMDLPLYVIEKLFKQLEEKLDIKWAEGRIVDSSISMLHPHQVFINFRGELRYNFISHLVDALRRKSINVFIDTRENRGEDISHLLKRIEDSRIAIVVFSSKYTESKWCLREAETIMERANQGKLKVLPVFYKVTPMNVKQLKGEFGDNFRDREREYRNDESQIKKWKKALTYIAGKIGIELNDQSDENDSIASIVEAVLGMLKDISLATQTVESHVNRFLDKGETSNTIQ